MQIKHEMQNAISNLPIEIARELDALVVDRHGCSVDAYMRTDDLLGHVNPGTVYRVEMDKLSPDQDATVPQMPVAIAPNCAVMDGNWQTNIDYENEGANILGGNGRYILPNDRLALNVPEVETNPAHLAYYQCRLVKVGGAIRFDTDAPLPITITSVGKNYTTDYLLSEEHGGGEFLEIHDRPHFHMPLDEHTSGHMIIGKTDSNGVRMVSAFRIPYGFGIMTAPWAIHTDSHLVGKFMVIYSVAKQFSTVIIRKWNGCLAPISIV